MLLEANLPDDVDALRALVLEQARALADLSDAKGKADARIERLQAILEAFQRHRFGRKSEQLNPDQFELALEDIETALGSEHAARDVATAKTKSERPRKTNRGALPAHLERMEQVVDVHEKVCPCCGGALHQIGEDVAERLDVVSTTFRGLVTRRPRYGCRSCENAGAPHDACGSGRTGTLAPGALGRNGCGWKIAFRQKAANARRAGLEGLYRKQQSRMVLLNSNRSYLILLQADANRALQRYE
tara:strand:+ start:37564 stop:38298 length:735 start_codon:yes stop_codon:yes gene_type:complete